MESEDGKIFIKHLAHYVRTHEKALANALQLQRRQQPARPHVVGSAPVHSATAPVGQHFSPASASSASSALAAAFSLPYLSFTYQHTKPAKLSLTPHHLFYLLTRFEALNISVGPMSVRLESPRNYVSFTRNPASDSMSIRSVSSVRSVLSGMSSLWSTIGLGGPPSVAKIEKSRAALEADLKYLYSSFTKIPCLKLAPDGKAKLVEGFEEFPFETAVPLLCFKNVTALEIEDIDIRQFYGWDQLAERLRSLSVKRGHIDDPAELIISIVLDDMDRRRRRSAKTQSSPIFPAFHTRNDSSSAPPSPKGDAQQCLSESAPASHPMSRGPSDSSRSSSRPRSSSPVRPASSLNGSTTASHHLSSRMRRSGSSSSHSSSTSTVLPQHGSSTSLSTIGQLPLVKWRFLRHLCLADNSLHSISIVSLAPLAGSLTSLDLSANLFTAVPDALSILSNLRALNLANNMIDSLHSLTKSPLPAITAFNLRANRLSSIAGIERLPSLERVDLRNNNVTDPTELARLTSAPNMSELWIAHNPFTKTHSSYRVTIFNLFRITPGYSEDVTIDGSGPGMVERRSLAERAAELPNVPVVKAPQPPGLAPTRVAPVETKKDDIEHQRQDPEKPTHMTTPGPVAKARKKIGRRRVVELTADDNSSHSDEVLISTTSLGSRSNSQPRYSLSSSTPVPSRSLLDDPVDSACSLTLPSPDSVDWALKGEEYRRKAEALKNEVGSGWLTVLSEEGLNLPSPDNMDWASQGEEFRKKTEALNGHYSAHSDAPQPSFSPSPITSV